ncbi:hypothetical protein [Actinomadura fibrosa]|uniref:Aminoacyl-transfer RNA synthetases class-II family profile domain-containing protein n=1 Tax=Actinomadura fibrosa TaxID=111802 RepID=A0ABW2Y623_9ACTN|nr:hypothetical protein [Actinomadura fibrosa]
MLADWAFCTTIQLDPSETSIVLDLLLSVRDPESTELQCAALGELAKSEPWIIEYALPAVLWAAGPESTAAGADRARLRELARHVARNVIDKENDDATRSELNGLVQAALLGKITERLLRATDRMVSAVADDRLGRSPGDSYLALPDFVPEVVLLSVLSVTARIDPQTVLLVCAGEEPLETVRQALDGTFGRLPLLLAARTMAMVQPEQAGSLAGAIWTRSHGNPEIEPDLLAAVIEVLFGEPGADPDGWLGAIETEVFTGERLRRFWTGDVTDWTKLNPVHMRLYGKDVPGDPEQRRSLPLVLWIALLWDHAARHLPEETARRLGHWWAYPKPVGATFRAMVPLTGPALRRWRSETLSLLQLRQHQRREIDLQARTGQMAQNSPRSLTTLMSPWLWRRNIRSLYTVDQPGKRSRKHPLPSYPQVSEVQSLIRMLGAANTAVAMMRHGGAGDHLTALVLHAADVTASDGFGNRVTNVAKGQMSRLTRSRPDQSARRVEPTLGLAAYVQRLVSRAGEGRFTAIPPSLFVDLLINAEPADPHRPSELQKLLTIGGWLTVFRWIQNASSGTGGDTFLARQGRWLYRDVDQPSPAVTAIGQGWPRIRDWFPENPVQGNYRQLPVVEEQAASLGLVAVLALQSRRRLGSSLQDVSSIWDWRRSWAMQKADWREVLLSPKVRPAEWSRFDLTVESGWLKKLPLALLRTERLLALLAEGLDDEGTRERWFDEWLASVGHAQSSEDLPRALRLRMIDLLAEPPADTVADLWHRSAETVIYLIAEFGQGTPWQYEEMFRLLAAKPVDTGEPVASADLIGELRYHWMHAVVTRQGPQQRSATMSTAHGALAAAENAMLVRGMIRRFVDETGSETFSWGRRPLGVRIADLWQSSRLSGPFTLVSERRRQLSLTDVRNTVAVSYDQRTGMVHRRVVKRSTEHAQEGREVTNFFQTALTSSVKFRERLVLGVVAALDGSAAAHVNLGLEAPRRVAITEPVAVGDLVAVPLNAQGGTVDVAGAVVPMARRPEDGEVRPALLRIGPAGQVDIEVPEYPVLPGEGEPDQELLVKRWNPNLLHRGDGTRLHRQARWSQADQAWLPVDLDLVELLAAKMRYRTAADTPAEVFVVTAPGGSDGTWRLTTEPGVCYLLTADDWEAESHQRLLHQLEQGDPDGLLVYAEKMRSGDDPPRLKLLADPPVDTPWPLLGAGPFDERIPRWRRLFSDETQDVVVARYSEEGGYQVDTRELTQQRSNRASSLHELGFPASLRIADVEGAGATAVRCMIVADELQLRAGVAEYRPARDAVLELAGLSRAEVFELVRGLKGGHTQTLKRGSWRRAGLSHKVRARTVHGLDVLVDTDSLDLTVGHMSNNLLNDRNIEISAWQAAGQPEPFARVPHAAFADAAGSQVPDWSRLGRADGLIARWPADPGAANATCTAWVRLGQAVVEVDLPLRKGQSGRLGDHLTFKRTADEWDVRIRQRGPVVNAVGRWEIKETTAFGADCVDLGFAEVDGVYRRIAVGKRGPVIFIGPAGTADPPETLQAAYIRQGARARSIGRAFRGMIRVEVGAGARRMFGTADAFPADEEMRVVDAAIVIERRGRDAAVAQRMLTLEPLGRQTRATDPQLMRRKIYENWIRNGDGHTDGRILGGRHLKLQRLFLATRDGAYIDTVPFMDDEPAWVEDVSYSPNDVRVRLDEVDGQWTASCRRTRPLNAAEFARVMVHPGRRFEERQLLRHPTYYAGSETLPTGGRAFRFEWGYGRTALIPQSKLRIAGEPAGSELFMFFGDLLRAAKFGPDGVLDIDPQSDVDWQINPARVLFEEARLPRGREMVFPTRTVVRDDGSIGVVAVRRRESRGETVDAGRRHDQEQHLRRKAVLRTPDRRERDAWLRRQAGGESLVLAILDRDAFERSEGRELVFLYVSGLQAGHHVFMRARDIELLPNDALITFELPDDVVPPPEWKQKHVTVLRRQFSHRESLLRRLYQVPDGEQRLGRILNGWVMVVELVSEQRSRSHLRGVTKNAPERSPSALVGYIKSQGGHGLGVIGTRHWKDQSVALELGPGMLFTHRFPHELPSWAKPGAIVRVSLEGRTVTLRPAISSDVDFLGSERGAVILPKTELIRSGVRPEQAGATGQFTVGGLPGAQVSATEESGRALMMRKHPKIAMIVKGRSAEDPSTSVAAAELFVDDQARPYARPLDGRPDRPLTWAQLSYRDCGAAELRELIDSAPAYYHDTRTGHWSSIDPQTGRVIIDQMDLASPDSPRPPLFFQQRRNEWLLRYSPGDTLRYRAFPATQLVESELADSGEAHWFPVVGLIRNQKGQPTGFWLETSPGTVLEVLGNLMVTEGGRVLDGLQWTHFTAGDLVRLRRRHGSGTQPDLLVFTDWKPGPRGALFRRTGRAADVGSALLPITGVDVEELSITLGVGIWRMARPVSRSELREFTIGDSVWLNRDNTLLTRSSEVFQPGDVVLTELGPNGLVLPSAHSQRIVLAESQQWPYRSSWMRDLLSDPDGAATLFRLCGGGLPLQVITANGATVTVAWPEHAPCTVAPRSIMLGQVLGRLDSTWLLVRSGGALLRMRHDRLVFGLPASLTGTVVESLRGKESIWLHTNDSSQPASGLGTGKGRDHALTLRVIDVLENETELGVLCLDPRTRAMYWLPAAEASWITDLTAAELRSFLSDKDGELRRAPVSVQLQTNGTVSHTRTFGVRRRLQALEPGHPLRVDAQPSDKRSNGRYLARIYHTDLLVELDIGGDVDLELRLGLGEPIRCEVAACPYNHHPGVIVVPAGRREQRLDLPKALLDSESSAAHTSYGDSYDAGTSPDARPSDPHHAVVWAANTRLASELAAWHAPLATWLGTHGPGAFGENDAELPLAPLLATIILLDRLGTAGNATADRSAVHLLWQAGLRAQRSLHVEPLMRHMAADDHESIGMRRRLSNLTINQMVNPEERQQILAFARAVLTRVPSGELELPEIAHALQTAVGAPSEHHDPTQHAVLLAELAPYGRALIPPRSHDVAQPELLPYQSEHVSLMLEKLLRSRLPLVLLSPLLTLPPRLTRMRPDLLDEMRND